MNPLKYVDQVINAHVTSLVVTNHTYVPLTTDNEAVREPSNNNQQQSGHQSNTPSTTPSTTPSDPPTSDQPAPTSDPPTADNNTPRQTSPSYNELNIITARPKRQEYAVEIARTRSFVGWPATHHLRVDDLVKAGFFYTGYSDTARCFYCSGGLRNWEANDDVWVEHARWFPKCFFVRQSAGLEFIKTIQDLSDTQEAISFNDVISAMKRKKLNYKIPLSLGDKTFKLEQHPAVQANVNDGFGLTDVFAAVKRIRENGEILAADLILDDLLKNKVRRNAIPAIKNDDDIVSKKGSGECTDEVLMKSLKDKTTELRLFQCKICWDDEVDVVFLPCGHFVCCNNCSFALSECPVCRDKIRGVVRAFLR